MTAMELLENNNLLLDWKPTLSVTNYNTGLDELDYKLLMRVSNQEIVQCTPSVHYELY